jgi:hypothetical protein
LQVPVTDYSFSSTHLDFGSVAPGEDAEVELTLTNGATGVIQIGDVATANPLAAPFTIVSDTCSNVSLAANASCTIRVRYAPVAEGTYPDGFNVPVVAPALVNHTIGVEGTSVETHTVSTTAGSGGSISPGTVEVVNGQPQSFTITPDAGYRIATVTGCNGTLVGNVYTVPAVAGACSVNATFEPDTHTLTTSAGTGGSISPTSTDAEAGELVTFTITPAAGYRIATVTGCNGMLVGNVYTVTAVASACAINATFELVPTHPVTISSGWGGNISPGSIAANAGEPVTFTITPAEGYRVATVTGCNGTLSGSSYTIAPVTGPCSISATYTKTTEEVVVTGRGKGGGGSFELVSLLLGSLLLALRRMRSGAAAVGLATIAATNANAADVEGGAFYAGATLGQAVSSESAGDLTRHLQDAGYDVQASIDDNRLGWRVFGGRTFNRYVAFEGGYTDLGEVTTRYAGTIATLDVQNFLDEAVVPHPRSADGFDASVVFRLPIGSRWTFAADLGVLFWDAEREVRDQAGNFAREEDEGIDFRYALSIDANLFGNVDLIASWSRFQLDDEHIDLPGLGLRYRW